MRALDSQNNGDRSLSSEAREARWNSKAGLYGLLYLFSAISALFYYFSKAENIADYDSYIIIINDLMFYRPILDRYFEVGSDIILFTSSIIADSPHKAVTIARIFTTIIFIYSIFVYSKYYKVENISIIFLLALYGPLLAYVTIRATPAYLLMTIAMLNAMDGRSRSILWGILAVQFHISALLALPLVFIALIQSRTNMIKFVEKSNSGILLLSIVASFIYILFEEPLNLFLEAVINQVQFLKKYTVYIENVDGTSISNQESSLYHLIYFIGCTLLIIFTLLIKNDKTKKIRALCIFGYVIFIFFQFSPVTAFRFSIFWTIPVIICIPWKEYLNNLLLRSLASAVALAIFIIQFSAILY